MRFYQAFLQPQNMHTKTKAGSLSFWCWVKEHIPITRTAGVSTIKYLIAPYAMSRENPNDKNLRIAVNLNISDRNRTVTHPLRTCFR